MKKLACILILYLCAPVPMCVGASEDWYIGALVRPISISADVAKGMKQKEGNKKEGTKEKKKKEPIINENDFQPVLIGALLEKPVDYIDKKIKFRGRFSSFTTLALDYDPALRKSKDYISIAIFRTDSMIPLSELKLAYPVEKAKEDQVIRELEEGDLIEINGQVFSAALDEPWVDIISIKKIESANKDLGDKKVVKEEEKNLKGKDTKNSKTKKNNKESK